MAKRSRRSRREAKKQTQVTTIPTVPTEETPSAPGQVESTASLSSKIVDFTQEYAYVYHDLRNVLIISVLMFVVLFGLAFAI
jgi:hypothetical protein